MLNTVLIVGAGPVGSILALELAHHGVPSVVVERSSEVSSHPKMDFVNARSMELLRRLGLAEELRAVGVPSDQRFRVLWTQGFDKPPVAEWNSASVDEFRAQMTHGNDGTLPCEPYQRVIGSRLEELCRRSCREHELIDLREGWTFENLAQDKSGVVAEITHRDTERRERIAARYLVGCDGAKSAVRRCLGIEVDKIGPISENCNVYFRSSDPALLQYGRFFLAVASTGLTLVSRDGANTWTGVFPLTDSKPFEGDPTSVLRERLGVNFAIDEILSVASWENRLTVAHAYRNGSGFLAGDSAHQFFPSGGHGANTGIADAVDLGWKLAAVISGWADAAMLDSYETERRPVALFNREMCLNAMEVWRRFMSLSKMGASRSQIAGYLDHHNYNLTNLGIHCGYRYTSSPIIHHEVGPEPGWQSHAIVPTTWPGGRAPSMRLQNGREIYDLLGREFTLVDFSQSNTGESIAAEAARRGVPIEHLAVDDPRLREIWERDLVLIRPDQHVAWRGNKIPADTAGLIGRIVSDQERKELLQP